MTWQKDVFENNLFTCELTYYVKWDLMWLPLICTHNCMEGKNQCLFDHDTGDARKTPQFEHVGQNIYLQKISKKVPGIKVKKAVKKWFGEVQDFDEHQISPFEFTYNTGHFSQLVWAETSEVLLKKIPK